MNENVHLLLCHEMPGPGQESRKGCEFADFFSHPDGATPLELLSRNIYGQIACPLKAGAHREASMAIVAQAIASIAHAHKAPTLLRTFSSLSDIRNSFNSSRRSRGMRSRNNSHDGRRDRGQSRERANSTEHWTAWGFFGGLFGMGERDSARTSRGGSHAGGERKLSTDLTAGCTDVGASGNNTTMEVAPVDAEESQIAAVESRRSDDVPSPDHDVDAEWSHGLWLVSFDRSGTGGASSPPAGVPRRVNPIAQPSRESRGSSAFVGQRYSCSDLGSRITEPSDDSARASRYDATHDLTDEDEASVRI